jgi:serine/threonine-protein kinase
VATEKKTIGKYEIVSELGRGGMGVVFKAWEESLQRFVAIKMLGDQLTDDENLVARFLREARSVADLNHPNIVQVFAVDTHEGRPYFAMEFVEGDSLSELIRSSNKIDPKRALTLVKEVAAGLSAAHDKGVVHRDIKPDNIMLTKHGGVKVVDFGVARVEDPNTKLTATGMAVGTPNYISPEVCLGLDVDLRSDLFSMGIVFYEMLTGETPFDADSPLEMMTNVVQAEVPDISGLNPDIDSGLRKILYHMLEKKPDYRYQDFHQVLEDIEAYNAGKPLPHASRATSQPTMKVDTQEVEQAIGRAPPIEHAGRKSRAPMAIVLALIAIGAVAGGWWYVGQEPVPPAEPVADEGPILDVDPLQIEEAVVDDEPAEPNETVAEEPPPANASEELMVQEITEPVMREADNPDSAIPVNAAPEPPPAPDYSDPALVVIVFGDPLVAATVESTLEGALGDARFSVMNEQFFDGYDRASGLSSLGRVVQDNGGDVLVLADIRQAGSRTLQYAGRSQDLTIATLEVTAMLPAERRNLGAPWQQTVEYTALNASEQARDATAPISTNLIERLNELKASQ